MIPTSKDAYDAYNGGYIDNEDEANNVDYVLVETTNAYVKIDENNYDNHVTFIFKHKDHSQHWRSTVVECSWEWFDASDPVPVDIYVIPTSMWLTEEEVLKYNI